MKSLRKSGEAASHRSRRTSLDKRCLLQDISSAYPAVLRALTAACQNDYNCKAAARQGAAGLAAMLLPSSCSETGFEAVRLLYTMTTQAEARLAVGKALANRDSPHETPAVDQLFLLLASSDAGAHAYSYSNTRFVTGLLKRA